MAQGTKETVSIAGTELVVFDHCGHRPEIEKQAEFTQRVQRFLA